MNRLAVIGLGLTVAGLLLVVGFWPLTSVSGADLLASRNGNQYNGYTQGSQITVHEEVVDVTYTYFFGNITTLELQDGDPNRETVIYVQGDARGVVAPGEVIYASVVLRFISGFYYCCRCTLLWNRGRRSGGPRSRRVPKAVRIPEG